MGGPIAVDTIFMDFIVCRLNLGSSQHTLAHAPFRGKGALLHSSMASDCAIQLKRHYFLLHSFQDFENITSFSPLQFQFLWNWNLHVLSYTAQSEPRRCQGQDILGLFLAQTTHRRQGKPISPFLWRGPPDLGDRHFQLWFQIFMGRVPE